MLFDPTTGQFRYEYAFATSQTGVESSGSLTDGLYQLSFNTMDITGTNGASATLPATNPNSYGGAVRYNGSGSSYTLNFHRLFGDVSGVGYIDTNATTQMTAGRNTMSGQTGYNVDLDFNNDGTIDTTTDYAQFTTRKTKYTSSGTSFSTGWDD